jgi:hypothetical protein
MVDGRDDGWFASIVAHNCRIATAICIFLHDLRRKRTKNGYSTDGLAHPYFLQLWPAYRGLQKQELHRANFCGKIIF